MSGADSLDGDKGARQTVPKQRQLVGGGTAPDSGSRCGRDGAATTRLNSLGNAGDDEKSGGTFCADAGPSDERGAVSMTRGLMMASISAISASIAWARRASIPRLSLVSEVRSRRAPGRYEPAVRSR